MKIILSVMFLLLAPLAPLAVSAQIAQCGGCTTAKLSCSPGWTARQSFLNGQPCWKCCKNWGRYWMFPHFFFFWECMLTLWLIDPDIQRFNRGCLIFLVGVRELAGRRCGCGCVNICRWMNIPDLMVFLAGLSLRVQMRRRFPWIINCLLLLSAEFHRLGFSPP